MNHPDYVYTPWSAARRNAASQRELARRGLAKKRRKSKSKKSVAFVPTGYDGLLTEFQRMILEQLADGEWHQLSTDSRLALKLRRLIRLQFINFYSCGADNRAIATDKGLAWLSH